MRCALIAVLFLLFGAAYAVTTVSIREAGLPLLSESDLSPDDRARGEQIQEWFRKQAETIIGNFTGGSFEPDPPAAHGSTDHVVALMLLDPMLDPEKVRFSVNFWLWQLGPSWAVHIFHADKTLPVLREALGDWLESGVRLTAVSDLTHGGHSLLMTSPYLYRLFDVEHILFMDLDGFVLQPGEAVDRFLEYDMIGAGGGQQLPRGRFLLRPDERDSVPPPAGGSVERVFCGDHLSPCACLYT
jgi:hypothetical protein